MAGDKILLLDIYAKNEKANIAEAEKRHLKRIIAEIVKQFTERS